MDGEGADRFEAFVDALAEVVSHADRVRPLRDYCMGLLTPAERKSVEPLAAVTAPSRVSAQHQSLLHFVAQSPWKIPAIQAVHRAQVALAAKGNGPAQRAFLRIVQGIENERHDLDMELLKSAIEYKEFSR
jgi:SRSO17 transposase